MPFAAAANNVIRVTGVEDIASLYADPVNTGWLQRQGHDGFYSYFNAERGIEVRSGATFTIADCAYTARQNNATNDSVRRNMLFASAGGTLIIGALNTARSATLPSSWRTFVSLWATDNANGQAFNEGSSVLWAQGGDVIVYGATIDFFEGQIRAQDGGRLTFRNARIFNNSTQTAVAQTPRIVARSDDGSGAGELDIDGLEISSAGSFELNMQGVLVQARRYFPRQVALAFHGTSAQGSNGVLIGGDGEANGADCSVQHNSPAPGEQIGESPYFEQIDHASGNAIRYSTKGIVTGNTQNAAGLIEGKINVTGRCVDGAAAGVAGVGVYLIDSDNGARGESLTGTGPHPRTGIDYDQDQQYATTSDAQGDFALQPLINVYDRRTTASPTTELTTDVRTPFLQRVRRYGDQFIEQALDNDQPVSLLFTINPSAAVTQSAAVAQAHTGITLTEHGSPVTWNGLPFGITITGDRTANPTLTADDIYHYLQFHLARVGVAFEGRLGGYWHDMVAPGFETRTGVYGGTRVVKGVRVIDENGDPFPGFTRFQGDTGAFYVVPVLATFSASVVAGSRVQLFNVTKGLEVDNSVSAGGAYSFAISLPSPSVAVGDVLRLRATQVDGVTARLPAEAVGVATADGLSFLIDQPVDQVYADNGIDGATVAEFTSDFPNIQVDVNDADDMTTPQRLYAWIAHEGTTADGIRNFFGAITAQDAANYLIDAAKVDLKIDNVSGRDSLIMQGARLVRSDGASIIATNSANSIQIDPGRAFLVSGGGGGGGLTPAQDQAISDIKAKTDQLAFIGGDVAATLDGEEVTTDAGSRSASRADVAPIAAAIATVDGKVSAFNAPTAAETADAVWTRPDRVVTGGADITLAAGQETALAVAVEAAILSEGDGQQVIDAIVQAIGNQNVNEPLLAGLIRDEIERSGGLLAQMETAAQAATRLATLVLEHQATRTAINARPTPLTAAQTTAAVVAANISVDANSIAAAVWSAATRSLTDKAGFSLTSAQTADIARAVEQSILNESDGDQVLNAIVGAIGNQNVDQVALVAAILAALVPAIRDELERPGGAIDLRETTATADARAAGDNAQHGATQAAVAALVAPLEAAATQASVDALANGTVTAQLAPGESAKLDEIWRINGLDVTAPVAASDVQVSAGDITIDLADAGLTTTASRQP